MSGIIDERGETNVHIFNRWVKMKKLALIILICTAPLLRGADIVFPAKLPAYEDSLVGKINSGIAPANEKGKIRVIVAAGGSDVVQRQEEMKIPRDSTVSDVGALWREKHGRPLLGWVSGLVIVRRKAGEKVERIAWTMSQARVEAPKFQLRNGDAVIGLMYSDY